MADLFKKIQDLVALQTREDLGQTNIIPSKGLNIVGQIDEIRGIETNAGPVRWDSFSYFHTRTDDNFIPTLEGRDNFFNTMIVGANDVNHDFTPWSKHGLVFSQRTFNKETGLHRAWGIRLTARQPNAKILFGLVIHGGVNFAIWIREYDKRGWHYRSVFKHVHDTIRFDHQIDIPISSLSINRVITEQSLPNISIPGTEIWLTSYTPPFSDTGVFISPTTIIFAVLNLADLIKDWTNLSSYSPVPQWYTPGGDLLSNDQNKPVLSKIDRTSRNIVNTLNMGIPTIPNWKSINVYRATAESVANIVSVPTDSNTVILDGAEPLSFASNSNILFNSDELSDEFDNNNAFVNGVNVTCGNKFLHGGEDITLDFGSVVKTNPATADSDMNLFDLSASMKFGANCLAARAKSTPTEKKGFFIDSNTLFDVSNFNLQEDGGRAIHFSFYNAQVTTIHAGTSYAEVRFQCGETPDADDRSFIMDIQNDNVGWNRYEAIFETSPQTIPNSQLIPAGYTKILIRLYLASSQYSDTFRLWDGFKICAFNKDDIGFGSSGVSTSDGVVVTLSDPMELPRLSSTGYHSYFSTTKSFTGEFLSTAYREGQTAIISDSAYYVDRLRFSKFGKGMLFTNEYRNLIESGDFNGPVDHWINTAGAISLDSYTTTGALFGSAVGRFYTSTDTNRSTYVYSKNLEDIYGSGAETGDSAFVLSLWAKGREKGTKFWMSLLDSGNPVEQSSKFITLSTSWFKYAISHRFTDDGDRSSTVKAMISITDENTVPSEVYIDGIQLTVGVEKSNSIRWGYSHPFNTLSTTNAAEVHSANIIKLHSCHSIINRNSGTIRFWYTPELDSHSATGSDAFVSRRTFFDQSSASAGIKCLFLNHPTINPQFSFSVDRGDTIETATISGINFVAHEPVHVICCWTMSDDASSAWMYVNTAKSNVIEWNGAGTSQSMNIGGSLAGNLEQANGFICNFRIDTSCWTEEYVRRDFYGTRLTVSTGIGLPRFRYDQIGNISRRGAETQNPIKFIDDEGLAPSTQYNYTFSVVDTIGNEGPLSTVKSITSSDMPDFRVHGTSATPRLILGQEKTDSAFVRLQPDGLFYHRPGENTAEGVSFMKHSESGVVYGGTTGINTFNRPFQNWEGIGFVPNMVVSPYTQLTYLPSHRDTAHGPLCFPYNVKSTGFRIAQRMVVGTPMTQSILMRPTGTIEAVVGRWDGLTYTVNHDSQRKYDTKCSSNSFGIVGDGQVGYVVTALSVPSKGNALIVNLKTDFFAIGPSQLLYLRMFTNIVEASTSWPYDQTNWTEEYSERHIWWVNENTGTEAVISIAFSDAAMKAKSIAFEISTPGNYKIPQWYDDAGGPSASILQKNRAFITDLRIMIYDSAVSIINIASARGTVGWTATDGFIDLSIA